MYNFQYVSKKEAKPVKQQILNILHEVQNEVRKNYTFQYSFIGSSKRNMITCDFKRNIGFDFDINIEVNDDEEHYTAKEIKDIFRNALNKIVRKYGYDFPEDSTRVLTIKMKDGKNKRIIHSTDFAFVHNCDDGQQYIRYNKKQNSYTWENQASSTDLSDKELFIKENGAWNEVRARYIEKKNMNQNPDKKSRSLYAETIHEICQRYDYYE